MQVEVVDGINGSQHTQAVGFFGRKWRECQFSGGFIPEETEVCAVAEFEGYAAECVEWDRGEVGDCSA